MTSRSTAEISTLREVPRPSNFAIALAEWMRARAAVAQCDAEAFNPYDTKTDQPMSEAVDAVDRAEWKLLQTPAQSLLEIRDRARI